MGSVLAVRIGPFSPARGHRSLYESSWQPSCDYLFRLEGVIQMDEIMGSMVRGFVTTLGAGLLVVAGLVSSVVYITLRLS